MLRTAIVLFTLFTCQHIRAQINLPCKDSLQQPDPYYICNCDYEPVCGCDTVTYRNALIAYNGYHVNYYTNGPCLGADFDINPTLFDNELRFEVIAKQSAPVDVFIRGQMGTIVYFQPFNKVERVKISIPTDTWQYGMYVITVIVYDGDLPQNVAIQSKKIIKGTQRF